jgi:seryl-tRNA synthetase
MAGETARVELRRPIPGELADELSRRMYYVSPEIVDFELLQRDGGVYAVRLRLDRHCDITELDRKLNAMVESAVLNQRRPVPALLWRSAATGRPAGPAFDELVRRGIAEVVGEGQVSFGEPMLTLFDRLDALLRGLAVDEFGAAPRRYPTLIPTEVLRRTRYLSSFPQHAIFATHLPTDLDAYGALLAGVEGTTDLGELVLPLCHTVDQSLAPTMCYHTFAEFAGRELAGPATITSNGKSFRFESRYHADLERLCDFTIREVVFLGERAQVNADRQRFFERSTALFDELGLTGYAEVASDPFLGNARTADAVTAQLMLALKYEARLYVDADRTVAVGSFNVHDQTFADAFDIRLSSGEPASSACVGFGLERLTYAVICQYGLAEADWPARLRAPAAARN